MNVSRFMAALVGSSLLFGLAAVGGLAQDAVEKPARPGKSRRNVALLDVNHIYKNYPRFADRMSEMKAEVERAGEEAKQRQQSVNEMEQRLKLCTIGTPEHTELESKITARKAELQASVASRKKAFLREEARIYYEAYQEILKEVEAHAQKHKITVVLKVNDAPVNVGNPDDVLREINSDVVWWDKRCDITRVILDRLTRKGPSEQPLKDKGQ